MLLNDLRYGLRALHKNPGFSLVVIFTLAVGIGANTAIFSIISSLLLRPLPARKPEQITVLAHRQNQGQMDQAFSVPEYHDLRSAIGAAFSDVIAYQPGLDGLAFNGKADRVASSYVTGNFFPALGLKAAFGRLISRTEGETVNADPIVVLGYTYWQSHFAADPGIVGQRVLVNGHPLTVIGIAPKRFHGLFPMADMQVYLPLGMAPLQGLPPDFVSNRQLRGTLVFGRLREGVALDRAQALLDVTARRIARDHPESDRDLNLFVVPELRARPNVDPKNTVAMIAALFLGLAILVLVLACVNVANILLVRATIREREMAIRSALGAGRGGLIRQLLVESLLLACGGGLAGVALGYWGSRAVASIPFHTDLPLLLDFAFDWRVFSFAFIAALATGLLVGALPAWRASRADLNQVLHRGGRGLVGGRNVFRGALVVAQVAGSLTLLIVAGLFVRSLAQAERIDLGFDPHHVLNLSMDPNEIGYNHAQTRDFYRNLLSRVRALPGVEFAGTSTYVPMGYFNNGDTLAIDGYRSPAGQPPPAADYNVISPDNLSAMRIRLLRGRAFSPADDEKAKGVAIVSQTMAGRFWPKQDPIGRRFHLQAEPRRTIEVVGIAADVRYNGVSGDMRPFFYLPYEQHVVGNSLATLQVRTQSDPLTLAPVIQRSIASLAPALPVFDVHTMEEALYTLNGLLVFQIAAGLAGIMGALGLALALIGVYGVMSYSASQHTHEIGVRMALGARPANILQMMLLQGVLIVGAGVVLGTLAALGSANVLGTFLVVSATDPLTYLAVAALLTAVALFACYLPARRAMNLDPMKALRWE